MTIWQAALLGLVQGVAEFLPISSSGHLNIGHHLFGSAADSLFFDVMLHVATAGVVVAHYRRQIGRYLAEFVRGVGRVVRGASIVDEARLKPGFRAAGLVVVTMLPLPLVAFLGEGRIKELWGGSIVPVSVCFLLTATVLFLGNRLRGGKVDLMRTGVAIAVCIGLAQAVAVLPGISRSGMTISMALLLGLGAGWAVEFSMLMSVPAILGAAVWEALHCSAGRTTTPDAVAMLVGMLAAMAAGYFALTLLVRLTRNRRLSVFSYYLWPLGGALLIAHGAGGI
jgi:undecaprenyl-diphosphatase